MRVNTTANVVKQTRSFLGIPKNETILKSVAILYETEQLPNGSTGWLGGFGLSGTGVEMRAGEKYRLDFSNGKSAWIEITGGGLGAVAFRGIDPVP